MQGKLPALTVLAEKYGQQCIEANGAQVSSVTACLQDTMAMISEVLLLRATGDRVRGRTQGGSACPDEAHDEQSQAGKHPSAQSRFGAAPDKLAEESVPNACRASQL